VDSAEPDSCATICEDAGMTCGHSQVYFFGTGCGQDATDYIQCALEPEPWVECPLCTCWFEHMYCDCVAPEP
jgi:hypothetical protein